MALQLGALRDALIEAGAKPESAARAAEELASYERELADIRADIRLLKWIVGSNVALTFIMLGSVFALQVRLGEIAGQVAQIAHAVVH